MRGRIFAAALIAAVLVTGFVATGAAKQGGEVQLPRGCKALTTASDFAPFAEKVWNKSRWKRRGGDPGKAAIAAMKRRRHCAITDRARARMEKKWKAQKVAFYQHRTEQRRKLRRKRELVALTPYSCGSAGRFAIPCYIVACESGYSWSAYNPSGALGPYQLLGWGAPFPVVSWADKMEHHRIAGDLWDGGGGASHWVCA